jgi:hypothetical protein
MVRLLGVVPPPDPLAELPQLVDRHVERSA